MAAQRSARTPSAPARHEMGASPAPKKRRPEEQHDHDKCCGCCDDDSRQDPEVMQAAPAPESASGPEKKGRTETSADGAEAVPAPPPSSQAGLLGAAIKEIRWVPPSAAPGALQACLVKVYDDVPLPHVCDPIEVVGILSSGPESHLLFSHEDLAADEDGMIEEYRAHNPPPSLAPRLHALRVTRLTSLWPGEQAAIPKPGEGEAPLGAALEALLCPALGEDRLAARYLALHLLSRVHARREGIPLGRLTLRLTTPNAREVVGSVQLLAAFPAGDFDDFFCLHYPHSSHSSRPDVDITPPTSTSPPPDVDITPIRRRIHEQPT
ncbi:putative Mini-chromosome maintenance replisome factor [Paratrimastix pyriformis]|uniref:Mini-chromosome maintenance replisome factor n=1 Tax=Paratrimastix pyriformis TaxID=342808 RepID=A0ABQ8UIK0_9EUKA|nr:putative Mini-chromosome maintenance replisome factor [Paratrimastix pyriformis]